MTWFGILVIFLVLLRTASQITLESLNRKHVLAHADSVPQAFLALIDSATYAKAVEYTLAKSRFYVVEILCSAALLIVALYSRVLPWAFGHVNGNNTWMNAAFLLGTGLILSLFALPLDYYSQFHIEERFGFNRTTIQLWWIDHLKGW